MKIRVQILGNSKLRVQLQLEVLPTLNLFNILIFTKLIVKKFKLEITTHKYTALGPTASNTILSRLA